MASSASRPCANDFGRTSVGRSGLRFHEATRRGSAIAARVASPGWFARSRSLARRAHEPRRALSVDSPRSRGARPPPPRARSRAHRGPFFARRTHAAARHAAFFPESRTSRLTVSSRAAFFSIPPFAPSTQGLRAREAPRGCHARQGRRAVRQARRPGRARRARGLAQRLRLGVVLDRRPLVVLARGSRDDVHRLAVELLQRRVVHHLGRGLRPFARGAQLARFGVPHPAPVRGVLRLRRHLLCARRARRDGRGVRGPEAQGEGGWEARRRDRAAAVHQGPADARARAVRAPEGRDGEAGHRRRAARGDVHALQDVRRAGKRLGDGF